MPGLEILSGTVANSNTASSSFPAASQPCSSRLAGGELQSLASGQIIAGFGGYVLSGVTIGSGTTGSVAACALQQ
jgi:hypothetical protein